MRQFSGLLISFSWKKNIRGTICYVNNRSVYTDEFVGTYKLEHSLQNCTAIHVLINSNVDINHTYENYRGPRKLGERGIPGTSCTGYKF